MLNFLLDPPIFFVMGGAQTHLVDQGWGGGGGGSWEEPHKTISELKAKGHLILYIVGSISNVLFIHNIGGGGGVGGGGGGGKQQPVQRYFNF